jgi:hypothetical protein
MVYDAEHDRSRLEFHIHPHDLMDYWRHDNAFPWKSFSLYRSGHLECGSRFADLTHKSMVSSQSETDLKRFPLVVTKQQFFERLHPVSICEINPIHYEEKQQGLELFLLVHQHVYLDQGIGIKQKEEYTCPTIPEIKKMNKGARRMKGGVIISGYQSGTSTIVWTSVLRSDTSTFILVNDTDYFTVSQVRHKNPHVSLWWGPQDINIHHKNVIMNYRLWQEFREVVMSKHWTHVVLDEIIIEDVELFKFNTQTLWIIDTEHSTAKFHQWIRLFQWPELFLQRDSLQQQKRPSEQESLQQRESLQQQDSLQQELFNNAYTMFMYYNVIYKHTYMPYLTPILPSDTYLEITEDYPVDHVIQALRNSQENMLGLCKKLLALETYECFDLLSYVSFLTNRRPMVVHNNEMINQEKICAVCHEEKKKWWRNEACCHVLCYQCMYTLFMLQPKCPLCRAKYGNTCYESTVSVTNNDKKPVMYRLATRNRMEELIYLVKKLVPFGKVIVTSGVGTDYLQYIYQVLCGVHDASRIYVVEEFEVQKVNMADIIVVGHADMWYLRHYPVIYGLITMELDWDRHVTKCMYYYFKDCLYKYVIAPSGGFTEILLENLECTNEKKLLTKMLHRLERSSMYSDLRF